MAHYTPNPGSGSYFKVASLDAAPHKLRIMSKEFRFAECWADDKTPVRAETIAELAEKRPAKGWRVQKDKEDKPKWVCGYIAWDHNDSRLLVASFHQTEILQGFDRLENIKDWGDIRGFDVMLSRKKGENGFFSYKVDAVPHKPLPKEAQEAYEKYENECVGLAALLTGGNPMDLFGN
jgi:hypothetical protein